MFSSPQTKSKAEKLRSYILQAFETVLGSPVTIEIRSESSRDVRLSGQSPLVLPTSEDGYGNRVNSGNSEIIEIAASPRERKFRDHVDIQSDKRDLRVSRASETRSSYKRPESSERGRLGELNQCRSLVRGKVSLAHVIQQAEGSSQRSGWTKRKAVSIAEKLEQENLRLEPRSRNLLCWKASRTTRRKLSRLKVRTQRPHSLLKFITCGKCMSSRSPK